MYLSLTICNEDLYQKAKLFFLQQWRSDLLSKESESLIWAYLITQYMKQNWKSDFSFINWVYSYEELYFSTSHSENLLIIAIDTKKITVDIEHIKRRNDSLLHNIKIPNSKYSPQKNFYLQWCAKECLIKFLNLTSNDMEDMKIIDFIPDNYFHTNEQNFQSLLILGFKWTQYSIHINIKNDIIIWLLCDSI